MPLVGTRKFLGIGLNYHGHAREVGAEIPKEPILSRAKAVSSLSGPKRYSSSCFERAARLGSGAWHRGIGKPPARVSVEHAMDAAFRLLRGETMSANGHGQMERGGNLG